MMRLKIAMTALFLLSVSAEGKEQAKNQANGSSSDRAFASLKKKYEAEKISNKKAWIALDKVESDWEALSPKSRYEALQMKSELLNEGDYPLVAAIFAAQAIQSSKKAMGKELEPSWSTLQDVSSRRPIQNIIETLAGTLGELTGEPPALESDWYYFVGNASERKKDREGAIRAYGQVKPSGRYYLPAKYQLAMLHVEQNELDKAVSELKEILSAPRPKHSRQGQASRREMDNFARLALGRVLYEKKDFEQSTRYFREVSSDSVLFYDALNEQAWPLFLGGYPKHALGAIHGAAGPFYPDMFNPEALMLRSIIYYWLCRYDDSREALADFVERYEPAVKKLAASEIDQGAAYNLFESLVNGNVNESSTIPKKVLLTAATSDRMLILRDQFAAAIEERNRLRAKGIFKTKEGLTKPIEYCERRIASLKQEIGAAYLQELLALKADYERIYSQAEFLYLQLMTEEKDKLMGKKAAERTQIKMASGRKLDVKGWSKESQMYAPSIMDEYWIDELGFHIYFVDSKCDTPRAK